MVQQQLMKIFSPSISKGPALTMEEVESQVRAFLPSTGPFEQGAQMDSVVKMVLDGVSARISAGQMTQVDVDNLKLALSESSKKGLLDNLSSDEQAALPPEVLAKLNPGA